MCMYKKWICLVLIMTAAVLSSPGARFFKNKFYPENIRWSEIKTDHFRILYMEGHEYLLPLTAQFTEDAYDFNSDIFSIDVENPIYLILYPSQQLFSQTQLIPAFLPPNVGGFATFQKDRVVVPFNGDVTYFRELIYHEVSHIFQYHTFLKNPLAGLLMKHPDLPTWIFEGLSEHAAGEWRNPKWMVLKDAVLNGKIHQMEYFKRAGSIDYLAYQEAHSLMTYLYTQYPEYKMDDFLKELNLRLDVNEALINVYDLDFAALYHRWRESLNTEVQNWNAERSSLFAQDTLLFEENALFIFPGEHFYITVEKGSLVRKVRGRDKISERLFTPSPFAFLMQERSLMALSEDRRFFTFIIYENSRYKAVTYDFFTQKRDHILLPPVTAVQKIFYANGQLHLLVKEGMKASGFIRTGRSFSPFDVPVEQADNWIHIDKDNIFFNSVGGQTYIHDGKRIFSVDGTLLTAEAFSGNSILLLLTQGKDNVLVHYNRKDFSFSSFEKTREIMTDFSLTKEKLIRYIYINGKTLPVATALPDLTDTFEGEQVYSAPDLTDAVYYEEDDFNPECFVDTLTFGGFLYGADITENKYVRLSTGMAMDSILNENQIFFVMSYHISGSKELDFGLYYMKTGNRPSYNIILEKNTVHRNDEEYNLSRLSGEIAWPLSLTDSFLLDGGVRLEGFLEDDEKTVPYGGLAFIKDTAYGRLYPDYGLRLFLYGGLVFADGAEAEIESDLRFYSMPFMFRLFYQCSPSRYKDSHYLRGYRETYFATKHKLMANIEMRTPMIWILPGFTRHFQLPPLSLFIFGDAGLFAEDLSETTFWDNGRLADPLASFGYGLTLHLNQNMNFDISFSHKTDGVHTEQDPVLEFSVNKLFY